MENELFEMDNPDTQSQPIPAAGGEPDPDPSPGPSDPKPKENSADPKLKWTEDSGGHSPKMGP